MSHATIEKEFGRFIATHRISGDLEGDSVCRIGELNWYAHRGVVDRIWRQEKSADSLQYIGFDLANCQFDWRSSFRIGPGIFVDRFGKAATVEEACRLAVECAPPEFTTFHYLGQKTDWYWTQNPRDYQCWTAAIEGERSHIIELPSKKFLWRRDWKAGTIVLALTSIDGGHLEGEAPTVVDAMRAIIDAPELFKRACAGLIATLQDDA